MDEEDEEFGEEKLGDLLAAHHGDSVEVLADAVFDAVANHTGDSLQTDDMTLLIIKRESNSIP